MAEQFLIERIEADGTEIKGLTRWGVDPRLVKALNAGSNELDPSLVNVTRSTPLFTFGTLDLGILETMFTGNNIPHIPIATAFDAWLQAAADGGSRGGAGTNTRVRATKGVIVPLRIGDVGGLAELTCAMYADFDGTNAPATMLADQDLPAGSAGTATRWSLRAIKDNTTALYKLGNPTLDFGIMVRQQVPANSIYSYDSVLESFAPTAAWDTEDIAVALAASGASGAIAGAGGLIFYLGQWDQATTPFMLAGSAMTLTMPTGSVYFPTTLRRSGEGAFTASYRAIGTGGSGTPPLALATGATLPVETTTAGSFRLGPAKDNTTEISIADWSLDFGAEWVTSREATLQWPSYVTLVRRQPTFELTTADMDYVDGIAVGGKMVATAFTAYARKMTANSEQQIDASAVHVKILCTAGLIEAVNIGGEHGALSAPGVRVTPTAGLTIATASAIT